MWRQEAVGENQQRWNGYDISTEMIQIFIFSYPPCNQYMSTVSNRNSKCNLVRQQKPYIPRDSKIKISIPNSYYNSYLLHI